MYRFSTNLFCNLTANFLQFTFPALDRSVKSEQDRASVAQKYTQCIQMSEEVLVCFQTAPPPNSLVLI